MRVTDRLTEETGLSVEYSKLVFFNPLTSASSKISNPKKEAITKKTSQKLMTTQRQSRAYLSFSFFFLNSSHILVELSDIFDDFLFSLLSLFVKLWRVFE